MIELSQYRRWGKRACDLMVSATALVALAIPIGAIAALVRVKLGSPVFFRQIRPGRDEENFELLKFRTMTDERDDDGELLPDGERITALGRILRNTSLDELPALGNVLKGDLSLVGPRPLLVRYQPYYRDYERVRFTVRPGITGLAQVAGRNAVPWDERLRLDAWYAKNHALSVDIEILFKTLGVVFTRSGVSVVPTDSMLSLDVERAQHDEY